MTEIAAGGAAPESTEPTATIVWIDSRRAVLVRWLGDDASVEEIESEVPIHHKSTGHVRHDPMIRHGGGGRSQTAGEPHRLEHLERFVEQIADRLETAGPVTLLGPGTVHERVADELRSRDSRSGRTRAVTGEASAPLTERQLIARLRKTVGEEPPRRTVGAYRWTVPMAQRRSGKSVERPRRVAPKPPADHE